MTAVVYTETGSSDRHYLLRLNGSNLELFDLLSGTVLDSQPLASVTSYTINGSDENDTLVIEDLITLAGGVFFNGGLPIGPPGDAIVVTGAATSTMVTYTNSTDGVITLTSGVNSMTVHFTGVDPIDMTGSTPSSLVFNLPGGTDAILEDDATAVNSTSQLRDQQAGFETTLFAHPTAALTINGGATPDNLTVNLTESLGAIALAINVGDHIHQLRRACNVTRLGDDRCGRHDSDQWRRRHHHRCADLQRCGHARRDHDAHQRRLRQHQPRQHCWERGLRPDREHGGHQHLRRRDLR